MIQKSTEDLIDAIHRVHREISALFEGNLVAIAEDAARRQALSGRPVWQPKKTSELSMSSDSGPNPVSSRARPIAATQIESVDQLPSARHRLTG